MQADGDQRYQGRQKLQPIGQSNLSKPFDLSKMTKHEARGTQKSDIIESLPSSRYKPDLQYRSELFDNQTIHSELDDPDTRPKMVDRGTGSHFPGIKAGRLPTESSENQRKAPSRNHFQDDTNLRRSLNPTESAPTLYKISKYDKDVVLAES